MMSKLPRENLILNQVEDPMTVHQTLMNVQTVSSSLHKRRKRGKKAKKDASQDDNNEQLDHTCDADVLCKECAENYYKTKRKCDWLRCIMSQIWLHEDCTIFRHFLCRLRSKKQVY
ncbi:hypothetical protein AVEN_132102-1 [Araneus ventricosus]|uniref:Uncharacterized protein n=1 Tax=Araneus ventricosus TaxID=182803 RepID=A0A4Y2KUS4_ARAVE|nr:hypothetical protein AVEN_132102-1 [Araneus ventricosus]